MTALPITTAIIVAGGTGNRMNSAVPKQYLPLGGIPMLARTLRVFDICECIGDILLVVPENAAAYCRAEILPPARMQTPVRIVAGGSERQRSVYNALTAVAQTEGMVAIHDGVRPFVTTALICRCVAAAARTGGCIPALPVTETIKRVGPHDDITGTVSRENLWAAQTPQVFAFQRIFEAHRVARRRGLSATDDAELMERAGFPVTVVPGDPRNIKITTRHDLELAEALLTVPS